MLIDAIPYAYAPRVLLLRFRELADVVDRHVLVEMDRTHTGVVREPAWPTLSALPAFAPFVDRVTWCSCEMPERLVGQPWRAEEHIRDVCLESALAEAGADGDVILLADHDEIPHPVALARVRHDGIKRARLWGTYHEWFLDLAAVGSPGHIWEFRQPITVTVGDPMVAAKSAGSALRALQWTGRPVAEFGRDDSALRGWHMTYQDGAETVWDKTHISAHTEFQHLTLERIRYLIETRRDILDRCRLIRTARLPATLAGDRRDFEGMFV